LTAKERENLKLKRQNSKLKTLRKISAWLSRAAGRAAFLRLVVEILDRAFNWGVFSVPFAGSAGHSLGPSGIGPYRMKEHVLPVKINVTSLISRRLEQKRPFFGAFLTLNYFDFSSLTKKMAKNILEGKDEQPRIWPGG
jgi:hypothetical protein